MKQQIIKIHGEESVEIVTNRIRHLSKENKIEVVIRDRRRDYSAEQRQTYWMWIHEMGAVSGELDDELHQRLKKTYLLPIYRRDDPDYEAMIAAVIASGDIKLGRGVVRLTSITTASRTQMSEYMDLVQRHAHNDLGVMLTMPDEHRE